MTLTPEELDPNSELRRKARANVATFEPLTGEELAEISRLFAGTNIVAGVRGAAATSGGAETPAATVPLPDAVVAGPASLPRGRAGAADASGPRRVLTGAGRDRSLPNP